MHFQHSCSIILSNIYCCDETSNESFRFFTGDDCNSKSNHSCQIPNKQLPEHKISSSNHAGIIKPKIKWILDPGSEAILKWNKFFLCSCLVSLFVDPLLFYIPSVIKYENGSSCMVADWSLGILVICLRSIADIIYLLHIIMKFRTAYISPSSRVLGRGELVMDQKKIALRYLKFNFFIDLVATLPLPQIVIWFICPIVRTPNKAPTISALIFIVLLQNIPRLYLIFPLSSQIIKTTGVITKTVWAGVAYNLVLYVLASHVLGASWYLLSFERHATCLRSTCRHDNMMCSLDYLTCGSPRDDDAWKIWTNETQLFKFCDPNNTGGFKYGIFGDAVTTGVFSFGFFEKCCYCLWWGLQNLSSYGQTLSTSTFIGETSFAILIATAGLVLLAHLIGNMQTYLQSITARLEEWRLRQQDTKSWMRHRHLPRDLQERVFKFVEYKWLATHGVNEESILHNLPKDLRRDIQRHLCLDLVRRVPFFSEMDAQLLDAMCERLTSSLSIKGTYIEREGDPVSEMLFIIRGRLDSSTTNGGRTCFFNSITLMPGDFCGEELLEWALLPKSTLNLPSSTRTVKALTEVEAFALRAEDLKYVANQFRRLHSKKFQNAFRFYSYHWRTWAACFIQAAWRQAKKRRMQWNLSMSKSSNCHDDDGHEIKHHDHTSSYNPNSSSNCHDDDGHEIKHHDHTSSYNPNSLHVTILASRFAKNTRTGILKTKDVEIIKLQKPEEPDFSADPDDEAF